MRMSCFWAALQMPRAWLNQKDNNGSVTNLYNAAGTVVDSKQTTSESAGTVTKGNWTSGP